MAKTIPAYTSEKVIAELWQRLHAVSRLTFCAKSGIGDAGWNGQGAGNMNICLGANRILLLEESFFKPMKNILVSIHMKLIGMIGMIGMKQMIIVMKHMVQN